MYRWIFGSLLVYAAVGAPPEHSKIASAVDNVPPHAIVAVTLDSSGVVTGRLLSHTGSQLSLRVPDDRRPRVIPYDEIASVAVMHSHHGHKWLLIGVAAAALAAILALTI